MEDGRYREQLRQDIARWRSEGIITAAQARAILNHARPEADRSPESPATTFTPQDDVGQQRPIGTSVLYAVGGVLLGAAALAIIVSLELDTDRGIWRAASAAVLLLGGSALFAAPGLRHQGEALLIAGLVPLTAAAAAGGSWGIGWGLSAFCAGLLLVVLRRSSPLTCALATTAAVAGSLASAVAIGEQYGLDWPAVWIGFQLLLVLVLFGLYELGGHNPRVIALFGVASIGIALAGEIGDADPVSMLLASSSLILLIASARLSVHGPQRWATGTLIASLVPLAMASYDVFAGARWLGPVGFAGTLGVLIVARERRWIVPACMAATTASALGLAGTLDGPTGIPFHVLGSTAAALALAALATSNGLRTRHESLLAGLVGVGTFTVFLGLVFSDQLGWSSLGVEIALLLSTGTLLGLAMLIGQRGITVGAGASMAVVGILLAFEQGGPLVGGLTLAGLGALLLFNAEMVRRAWRHA